jgi:hypothetical protein
MLKIRDDIDLKELEKYDFKAQENVFFVYKVTGLHGDGSYISVGNDRKIKFKLQSMSFLYDDFRIMHNDLFEIDYSYNDFVRKIDDLIQDGLVEKVEKIDE